MHANHKYTDCPHCGQTLDTRRMKDSTIAWARLATVLQVMAVVGVMIAMCWEWS